MAMMSMRTDRLLKGRPGAFSAADGFIDIFPPCASRYSRPAALLGDMLSSLFGRSMSFH
jgi:hypothetical protein